MNMNLVPKNEFELQFHILAIYYYARAQKKELERELAEIDKKIENEALVRSKAFDSITAGVSATFNTKSVLTHYRNERLSIEADMERYDDILRSLDKRWKISECYSLLSDDDKKYIYAVFIRGMTIKDAAEELEMNEKYLYRKIKKVISEMMGVEETYD